MKHGQSARRDLLALLTGENSHMTFDEAVAELSIDRINDRPPNTPYRLWHFVEHLRIAQWDILEFIRDPDHVSPDYPMGYRPRPEETADEQRWHECLSGFRADLKSLKEMVADPAIDLFAPLPHAPDYTLFREIITVSAHNSYHIGELALLRQVLDLWPAHLPYLTGRPD